MANDVLSSQDAILRGRARAEAAFKHFLEKWSEPMIEMNMKAIWAMMPPEQKAAMQKANPQLFDRIVERMRQAQAEGV